jgi:hypothetical protein
MLFLEVSALGFVGQSQGERADMTVTVTVTVTLNCHASVSTCK